MWWTFHSLESSSLGAIIDNALKVLANVLANRVRWVMNLVIRESQMAFINGCQIIDSFIIAEEIIQEWKGEKEGGLLVKLDFEKTYDSVDRDFLNFIMEGMGFEEKLRKWIRDCISTPTLSAFVHGSPTSQFGM
ncbi:hypothetical protein Ddye_009915 [Dipteronia dyeriana]|uniref:Reverse transcriptase domain-containing protein n=1 Tax=Dipteronia dyeriana TaxID=168575 RepID=A0AAE0CNB2_9ROSI|nr:hypothetical protein Ddye_009915 [Dipteronia dyeriana]